MSVLEQDAIDAGKAFLEHHGIKGMKWGVRRKSDSSSNARGATFLFRKQNDKEDAAAERAAAKSGRKEKIRDRKKAVKERRNLSDAELEKRVKRAQLEKQLREVTDQDLAPKRTAVKKALGGAAKTVAATALPALATYAGRQFVKKYMKNESLANEVFPPKTQKKKAAQKAGAAVVAQTIAKVGSQTLPSFTQTAVPRS